jgi:hypothetical protein
VTTAQVIGSFVAVGAGLAEARETAQYQLEQEEKKKGKAAVDRATALRRQVSTLHHRAKELEQVIGVLFQGVFAHRFRCVRPGARGAEAHDAGPPFPSNETMPGEPLGPCSDRRHTPCLDPRPLSPQGCR